MFSKEDRHLTPLSCPIKTPSWSGGEEMEGGMKDEGAWERGEEEGGGVGERGEKGGEEGAEGGKEGGRR